MSGLQKKDPPVNELVRSWRHESVITRHAELLGFVCFKAALGARHRLAPLVLEALPPDVVLAVARLAAQTRVLAVLVARLAFVRLGFEHLARGLVLELVVLAQVAGAERAPEDSASVIPNGSLAFDADGLLERALASVDAETLASVADPGLTVVADGTLRKR